jgi:hypothetical protein
MICRIVTISIQEVRLFMQWYISWQFQHIVTVTMTDSSIILSEYSDHKITRPLVYFFSIIIILIFI